jgi:predicted dinucleotide-binding enzyme
MKIAIIGAGNVGTALGEGLRGAGHDVMCGVRTGSGVPVGARAAPPRDAAAGREVVMLPTPWSAAESVVRDHGDLGGRVLVGANNPIAAGFKLAAGHTTSGAESLQALATNARVVKGFNTVGVEVICAPRFLIN